MIYKNIKTIKLKGSENMESWNMSNMAMVLVIVIEINGIRNITQRKEKREGTIKKPPMAIEVRM
jgi:hypothetical protein